MTARPKAAHHDRRDRLAAPRLGRALRVGRAQGGRSARRAGRRQRRGVHGRAAGEARSGGRSRRIAADGQDLAFVTVRVLDAQGGRAPTPITWCDSTSPAQRRWPGWATAIPSAMKTSRARAQGIPWPVPGDCQSGTAAPGPVRFSASSVGLKAAAVEIRTGG